MAKRQSALSAREGRRARKGRTTIDSDIDFSDIPEFSKKDLARARPIGRPRLKNPKKLMAIRLSPKLIYDLRKLAKKRKKRYQTLLHELLEDAVRRAA